MKLKAPLIFLFINSILAVFVLINFALKTNPGVANALQSNSTVNEASTTISPNEEVIIPAKQTVPSAPVQLKTGPLNMAETQSKPKVCMALGPLTVDETPNLNKLISQNGLQKSVVVDKKPLIEIYWNLGANEQVANVLFQKQKTTTMTNPKFVLQKSGFDWIVPITIVSNAEQAKNIIADLASRANKSGAGGRWQYRTKAETYNYQFNDIAGIPMQTLEQIKLIAPDRLGKCD